MIPKFIEKIRQHSAIASGNFAKMFHEIRIPPLPAATARLIAEINKSEPDIQRLVRIISSDVEFSTKIIRTINSSLYCLPVEVKSIQQAITLLGLKNVRTIALSYTMKNALPEPKGTLFNHDAFWTDSLIRSLFARTLTARILPKDQDEAFTVMLLSDLAIPILLCVWEEYYSPIIEKWSSAPKRLSEIERENFGWDHSQAGAWILKSWNFPDELVCYCGAHNLSIREIEELGISHTLALPLAATSILPSVIRFNADRLHHFSETVSTVFNITHEDFQSVTEEVKHNFEIVCKEFEIDVKYFSLFFETIMNSG